MIRLTIVLIILTLGAFYISAPSEADITACVEVSNYNAAQCRHELTK